MNVERSLKRDRKVEIYYIYQNPQIAWELTKKREAVEHRFVSREVFINAFVASRANANQAKRAFKNSIELNLIIKDVRQNTEQIFSDISLVDDYLPRIYTKDELEKIVL